MGRRPKPEGQLYVFKTLRIPPDIWRRFEALVPRGERSAVIHRLLREEVGRLESALEWVQKQAGKRQAKQSEDAAE